MLPQKPCKYPHIHGGFCVALAKICSLKTRLDPQSMVFAVILSLLDAVKYYFTKRAGAKAPVKCACGRAQLALLSLGLESRKACRAFRVSSHIHRSNWARREKRYDRKHRKNRLGFEHFVVKAVWKAWCSRGRGPQYSAWMLWISFGKDPKGAGTHSSHFTWSGQLQKELNISEKLSVKGSFLILAAIVDRQWSSIKKGLIHLAPNKNTQRGNWKMKPLYLSKMAEKAAF